MRTLTYAVDVSVDDYVAAPDGDLGWGVPSDGAPMFPALDGRVARYETRRP